MITGATLCKNHFFNSRDKLFRLQDLLFETAVSFRWKLEAWSLFSNHYHVIGSAGEETRPSSRWIQRFHSLSAEMVNETDGRPGRQIWYQYWDRALTFEASYWPRLNYVANNPVKHGLVDLASDYPFCSARWMELEWSSALRRKLSSFRYDRIREFDDFEPIVVF
jgi:putative transposase